MRPNRFILLLLCAPVFFTQCNTPQRQKSIASADSSLFAIPPNPKNQDKESAYLGEWRYSSTIYSSSELVLKNGHIFTYHFHGCTGHTYTEGTWIENEQGQITLTSSEKFRESEVTHYEDKFKIPRPYSLKKAKNGKWIRVYSLDTSYLNRVASNISPDDTSKICFDQVSLKMKDGMLLATGYDRFLFNAGFHKTNSLAVLK